MKNLLKIFITLVLFILFIFLFYTVFFNKKINKSKFEKENIEFAQNYKSTPFSISKIVMYSSAYGKNKDTSFETNNWLLDIFQYTDIAVYIDNGNDELSYNNTLKKLYIDNIKITNPKVGTPNLYFLDTLNFGTANINKDYKIEDSLEYSVLNDNNKENNIQSNTPVFFSDCSNPITLKYVNSSIKENYAISTTDPIFFNGKLLKMASIPIKNLTSTINLKINIENNNNEKYYYNLSLPITLKKAKESIFDGSILFEEEYENFKFLKTK